MNIKRYIRDLLRSFAVVIWAGFNFIYNLKKKPSTSLESPFLIISTNGIGDFINTLPAIEQIRKAFPRTQIDCLVQPETLSLLNCVSSIDKGFSLHKGPFCFSFEKAIFNFSQILKLRKNKYKTSIALSSNFYTAWRSFLIGVEKRCGYSRKERIGFFNIDDFGFLYTDDYKTLKHSGNHAGKHIDFIQAMGIQTSLDVKKPLLTIDAKLKKSVQSLLSSKKASQKAIIINPFSTQPIKTWPLEKYIELVNKLLATGNFYIILTGAKSERCKLLEMKERCEGKLKVVYDLELDAFAALISCADLLIGNDSGPIHIASAVATKAIAIFGPTDPLEVLPFEANVTVVKQECDCSPCYNKGSYENCYLKHHNCMKYLEVEKVFSAATQAL